MDTHYYSTAPIRPRMSVATRRLRYHVSIDMREGWLRNEYLVLFADREVQPASTRYGIPDMLPGYQVVGLRGWDDFIVEDQGGNVFTVPVVPCDAKHLTPYELPVVMDELDADDRFTGKLKWYIKPIAFGGDPGLSENLRWVSHTEHAELVRWWNAQYRAVTEAGEPN